MNIWNLISNLGADKQLVSMIFGWARTCNGESCGFRGDAGCVTTGCLRLWLLLTLFDLLPVGVRAAESHRCCVVTFVQSNRPIMVTITYTLNILFDVSKRTSDKGTLANFTIRILSTSRRTFCLHFFARLHCFSLFV